MFKPIITLYTRNGCHLCEYAEKQLLELKKDWDFTIEKIDIDQSDDLIEQYGLTIPVVLINGEEMACGMVNKIDISNRLQEKT